MYHMVCAGHWEADFGESFNLAREVESIGVTSDFLDICLKTFFDRFVPVFPVSHQPTFSLKDCSSPLLLNMVVLGSVFVASDDALEQVMLIEIFEHPV